jgi:hypothetical protein
MGPRVSTDTAQKRNSLAAARPISLLAPVLTVSSLADFLILPSTLKMDAIRLSETSVYTSSTWCHIPEDYFLHPLNSLSTNHHSALFKLSS